MKIKNLIKTETLTAAVATTWKTAKIAVSAGDASVVMNARTAITVQRALSVKVAKIVLIVIVVQDAYSALA
jgi:hypothetical protein